MTLPKEISIADIYNKQVDTISEDLPVIEAIRLLEQRHANAFVVLNAEGDIAGILSIQDIAAATVPIEFREHVEIATAMYKKGLFVEMCEEIKNKKISEIMRRKFVTVDLNSNIMVVMSDFLMNDLYVIPVVQKGKLVGIISRTQIKKALNIAFNI